MKLALLALSMLLPAMASATTLYVLAGSLVDVDRGVVPLDRLIRIDDGRISAVAPWTPPPPQSSIVDWSRYMVLPGLIDVHTHLAVWDTTNNVAEPLLHSAQETALAGAAHARVTPRAGFTSVHDVGCFRALTGAAP